MPELDTIREGWDQAAREDAMFNIVTLPEKANGGWTPDEFFEHGRAEIDPMMRRVGWLLKRKGRALDFGCGVGRLTQALAFHFKRVDGVDISPEMVDRARSMNRHPGRVEYHRNTDRLPFRAGTFDLVYSRIVLQHMPAEFQRDYVREFLRVLKQDGLAVFQIPDGPDYEHPNGWLSMFGVARETVEGWVAEADARLLDVELLADGSGMWQAYRYTVTPR